jgi:hypothetical protein
MTVSSSIRKAVADGQPQELRRLLSLPDGLPHINTKGIVSLIDRIFSFFLILIVGQP